MPLHAALAAIVGADAVEPGRAGADVTGRALGTPTLRVRTIDTAQVAAVVAACRAHQSRLSVAGRMSAYWSPLHLNGTVLVEPPTALTRAGEVWLAGAGGRVRELDVTLRASGAPLPLHPDAFGDTVLGALIAGACTSGIGMGQGGIGAAVAGIEVVTGRGDVLWTGSAAREGVPPFLREGLPDLTGVFVGAEGGLGIVTRVALLHRPPPWRVRVSGWAPDAALNAVVDAARTLTGIYDTIRLVQTSDQREGWRVDAWIVSDWAAREAAERAVEASRRLVAAGLTGQVSVAESAAARGGRSPDYDARWNPEAGGLAAFTARARLAGLDVNAPWSAMTQTLALARALVAAQVAAGIAETRLALYLAPDFVNIGVHASVPHESSAWGAAEAAPWFERFAALPLVPYRVGRTWPPSMLRGLERTRSLLHTLADELDPDHLLAPEHPLWTR